MLTEFLIEHAVTSHTALGSPAVDGIFIDDACLTGGSWPLEEVSTSIEDMGLSNATTNKTAAWADILQKCKDNEAAVFDELIAHKGFEWHLLADFSFPRPSATSPFDASCSRMLRNACAKDDPASFPRTHGVNPNTYENRSLVYNLPRLASNATSVPNMTAHLATFLLLRSDYAWIGYAWAGCTSSRSSNEPVLRPPSLDSDYGKALGRCAEASPGVFRRELEHATVELDCGSFTGSIKMHASTAAGQQGGAPAVYSSDASVFAVDSMKTDDGSAAATGAGTSSVADQQVGLIVAAMSAPAPAQPPPALSFRTWNAYGPRAEVSQLTLLQAAAVLVKPMRVVLPDNTTTMLSLRDLGFSRFGLGSSNLDLGGRNGFPPGPGKARARAFY